MKSLPILGEEGAVADDDELTALLSEIDALPDDRDLILEKLGTLFNSRSQAQI